MEVDTMRTFLLAVLALCWSAPLFADTLTLKNGNSISGVIKEEDANSVELEINIGSVKFNKSEIRDIQRSTGANEARELRTQWKQEQQTRAEEAKEQAARIRIETAPAKEPRDSKVKVDRETGHIITPVLINGQITANMIVDTGASVVVLSQKTWDKLLAAGTKPTYPPEVKRSVDLIVGDGRKVKAEYVILRSIKVQDASADYVEGAIMPDEASPTAKTGYDGVLGMSFLSKFKFGFNQKEGTMTLEKLK
jgi:clan AA aspartic protease (TIGR02281 family)